MTPKEQIHIHVNCNSLCKKSWTFSSLLQTYPVCHFLVEKICHCPNWVPELWRPLGWPETGTDLLRLLFVFHQYICLKLLFCEYRICEFLSWGFVDLCVWIYLVWWAIITCGRKYQLSEVDAHMDQLLLALLIGHLSRARRFSFF